MEKVLSFILLSNYKQNLCQTNIGEIKMKKAFVMKSSIVISVLIAFFVILSGFSSTENPDDVIKKLKEGNVRFVENNRTYPNQDDNRLNVTAEKGQFPYATVIACSDSRVPVEHIFDAGIGDIFVIRVAGNVVDIDEAGSIEYGVHHLHTPVLVILGHTNCGAVTAVCRGDEVHGNIPKLVDNIEPAVKKAKHEHGDEFNDKVLEESIKNNVWQSVEDLIEISPVTVELMKEGKLKVVGAIYHLDSGKIEWLGEHPNQDELLAHSE